MRFRRALRHIRDSAPEVIVTGGVGNGLVLFVFCKEPSLRTPFWFIVWAVVGCGLVIAGIGGEDEIRRGEEPASYLLLAILQAVLVTIVWLVLE